MDTPQTTVFWSYSHADDASDGGRVLRLAEHLREAYELLTGDSLQIFVDRDGLEWGDYWRRTIDSALVQSSFFIPILTPRYFTRPECRRELLAFHAQAESRGLGELIMPILYVPIAKLREDSPDEALALASRIQYSDWTNLRLKPFESEDYRRQVDALAQRLISLVSSIESVQLSRELTDTDHRDDSDSLEDLLERAELLWPDWLEAVEGDEVRDRQHAAVNETYATRVAQRRQSGSAINVLMAVYLQHARDVLPLSQQHLAWAETYHSRTIELDPVVTAAIRYGRENVGLHPVLADLEGKIAIALRIIEQGRAKEGAPGRMSSREYMSRMPYPTRAWMEIIKLAEKANTFVNEANDRVIHWGLELEAVLHGQAALPPSTMQ